MCVCVCVLFVFSSYQIAQIMQRKQPVLTQAIAMKRRDSRYSYLLTFDLISRLGLRNGYGCTLYTK